MTNDETRSGSKRLKWEELSEVTWQASAADRSNLHFAVRSRGCPTRSAPYGEADPAGIHIGIDCRNTGCLDLFHDLLVAGHEKLSGSDQIVPDDFRRFAYVVVTRLISDRKRQHRVQLGYPARPGRSDGAAARVISEIQDRHPETREWLSCLFRMIRDYVYRLDRNSVHWPLDGWALEKSRYDGVARWPGLQTRREIRADIASVVKIAADVLGEQWVRQNVLAVLPAAGMTTAIDDSARAQAVDLESILMSRWLRSRYLAARRAGDSAATAYRSAARSVAHVDAPPITVTVRSLLRDLDGELAGCG